MFKNFKKFVLLFLSFSILLTSNLSLFAQSVYAETQADEIKDIVNHEWYAEQSPLNWYLKVYDTEISPSNEIFGERYTAAQVQWIFYSLMFGVLNLAPGNPKLAVCLINKRVFDVECLKIYNDTLDAISPIVNNTIENNKTAGLLSTISSNPISGIGYVKSLVNKFSPVSEVQAQGFGYKTGGDAIKKLWQISRNISFGFLVLAIIVMAFMIMFRIKIAPQVIITVQSALPNLIITTILITFSYAIAGFAIDLMYVVLGIISAILTSGGLSNDDFIGLFKQFITNNSAFLLMYMYWVPFMGSAVMATVANASNGILGILVIIVAIISILFLIFWSLKIIFVLLKNFAMILLTIATGPFAILVGAFTGKSTFGGWFRNLLSYLAVYPLMALIFFFAFFFLNQGSSTITGSAGSTINVKILYGNPKLMITDNPWLPPFSGFALGDNILWVVVSFVILSQATKALDIIQAAIAGKPFSYGSAIAEGGKVTGGFIEGIGRDIKPIPGSGSVEALGKFISTISSST